MSGKSRKFNTKEPSFIGKVTIPVSAINAALTSGKDINLDCNIDVRDVSVNSYYENASAYKAGVITNLRIEAASLKEDLEYNQAKEYDAESDDASTAKVYSAEDVLYSWGWSRAAAPKTIEFKCQLMLSGDRLDGDVQAIATMTLDDELTYAYEDLDSIDEENDEYQDVTASSKKSYNQGEATIKRVRTAYAKANRFLAANTMKSDSGNYTMELEEFQGPGVPLWRLILTNERGMKSKYKRQLGKQEMTEIAKKWMRNINDFESNSKGVMGLDFSQDFRPI